MKPNRARRPAAAVEPAATATEEQSVTQVEAEGLVLESFAEEEAGASEDLSGEARPAEAENAPEAPVGALEEEAHVSASEPGAFDEAAAEPVAPLAAQETPAQLRLNVTAHSDIGCVRSNNEDSFGYDPAHGLYIVCDGMGGMASGEIASSMAVSAALSTFAASAEKDLDQSSTNISARTISAEQQASYRMDIERQHQAIARLRSTQSTGRIVFDLKPDSIGVDALPDIALQNGDRLVIPSAPITVSVMGTVYNQSSFIYEPDSSIHDYLKRSGGPTKFADTSQMFVIRANGSVLARAKLSHFETIAVRPGDAVIVPANTLKSSLVRNFMDWSQVLSGFGLAAAAVNVLK